jgi:hypothetical protein
MMMRMDLLVRLLPVDDGTLLVDEADPSRRVVRDAWHVLYAVHVHGLVDADDMRDDV